MDVCAADDKLATARCQVIHSLGALLQTASVIRGEVGRRRKVFEAQSKQFTEAREKERSGEKTDRVENSLLRGNRYQILAPLKWNCGAVERYKWGESELVFIGKLGRMIRSWVAVAVLAARSIVCRHFCHSTKVRVSH